MGLDVAANATAAKVYQVEKRIKSENEDGAGPRSRMGK